jgi:hypothetical protein
MLYYYTNLRDMFGLNTKIIMRDKTPNNSYYVNDIKLLFSLVSIVEISNLHFLQDVDVVSNF